MLLQVIWFVLIGVLLAGYAVLDGFDLGVGTLYPFLGKTERDKLVLRKSIGPVWDGNEVWLLTGAGAIFAAFPPVYATVFSGFYLALMLVLFALIFRAVSLEYRAHDEKWAGVWDWSFFLGSALPSLLFGVAVGNIALGVPMAGDPAEFTGNFFTLLGFENGTFNPFPLVIGVLGLSLILLQGVSWVAVKSEDALYDRSVKMRSMLSWVFIAMVVVATVVTALFAKGAFAKVIGSPIGLAFVAVLALSLAWSRFAQSGKDLHGWYAASLSAVALIGIWAAAIFPNMVPKMVNASGVPVPGLTIFNSSSSQLTLTVMLIITVIFVPVVLIYEAIVYKKFAGKVKIEDGGY
jgi:cytochrome bd ubiquinol oxidase subunit II